MVKTVPRFAEGGDKVDPWKFTTELVQELDGLIHNPVEFEKKLISIEIHLRYYYYRRNELTPGNYGSLHMSVLHDGLKDLTTLTTRGATDAEDGTFNQALPILINFVARNLDKVQSDAFASPVIAILRKLVEIQSWVHRVPEHEQSFRDATFSLFEDMMILLNKIVKTRELQSWYPMVQEVLAFIVAHPRATMIGNRHLVFDLLIQIGHQFKADFSEVRGVINNPWMLTIIDPTMAEYIQHALKCLIILGSEDRHSEDAKLRRKAEIDYYLGREA